MAKIWLVEDDRNLADLTKTALAKKGHEVVVFHEGFTFIEQAKGQSPDLILMDIMLPRVSGAEVVRELRKHNYLTNIPIIFLTALIGGQEGNVEQEGINIDGTNYKTLGKPYHIEQLYQIVGSVLK